MFDHGNISHTHPLSKCRKVRSVKMIFAIRDVSVSIFYMWPQLQRIWCCGSVMIRLSTNKVSETDWKSAILRHLPITIANLPPLAWAATEGVAGDGCVSVHDWPVTGFISHWIGLREHLNRKPIWFPHEICLNMGCSCCFFPLNQWIESLCFFSWTVLNLSRREWMSMAHDNDWPQSRICGLLHQLQDVFQHLGAVKRCKGRFEESLRVSDVFVQHTLSEFARCFMFYDVFWSGDSSFYVCI